MPFEDIMFDMDKKGIGKKEYGPAVRELIGLLNADEGLKDLFDASVARARKVNPDPDTNPIEDLEDYLDLIDRCVMSMPWTFHPSKRYVSLYDRIDQSMGIMYFILEQPLKQLEGKGYYHPSLINYGPVRNWFKKTVRQIGRFLDSEDSWNERYLELAKKEEGFHLNDDLFEDPKNWHCFNDFFSRRLKDPDRRPIAAAEDDHVIVSPADATMQGLWRIDEEGRIIEKEEDEQMGLAIKTGTLCDISSFLGTDRYKKIFAGGYLTHTFLDINDYHRYHFPVSGQIIEAYKIDMAPLPGGVITWDEKKGRYREVFSEVFGWQSLEERGVIIMKDRSSRHVAVCPVGMCQVASVNFEDDVKASAHVKKGDPMGYFLYGGSDIVMIFEKDAGLSLSHEAGTHLNTGEEYARVR